MANIKISELNELEQVDNDDLLVIVDTSANETKKVKARNVGTGGGGSDVVIISDTQPTSEDNKIWIDTGEVQNLGSEIHIGSEIDSKIRTNILFSKNLFDKDSNIVTPGYIDASGNVVTSDNTLSYQNTFIKVKPNTKYTISSSTSTTYRIAEYNSNQAFIQRTYNLSASTSYTITTSANTKFIKMAGVLTTILPTLMLNEGETALTYQPYITPTINVYGEDIYVKGQNEVYSTTEQVIGTWINGKPIYRKVIKTTLPNASTGGTTVSNNEATNVSDADLMYIANSFIVNGSETYPMPFITSQGYREWATANKTIVYVYNQAPALNGKDAYITIEYTKTTD